MQYGTNTEGNGSFLTYEAKESTPRYSNLWAHIPWTLCGWMVPSSMSGGRGRGRGEELHKFGSGKLPKGSFLMENVVCVRLCWGPSGAKEASSLQNQWKSITREQDMTDHLPTSHPIPSSLYTTVKSFSSPLCLKNPRPSLRDSCRHGCHKNLSPCSKSF